MMNELYAIVRHSGQSHLCAGPSDVSTTVQYRPVCLLVTFCASHLCQPARHSGDWPCGRAARPIDREYACQARPRGSTVRPARRAQHSGRREWLLGVRCETGRFRRSKPPTNGLLSVHRECVRWTDKTVACSACSHENPALILNSGPWRTQRISSWHRLCLAADRRLSLVRPTQPNFSSPYGHGHDPPTSQEPRFSSRLID